MRSVWRAVAALATVTAVGCSAPQEGPVDPLGEAPALEHEIEHVPFDLYFPGEDGRLYAEPREMIPTGDPAKVTTRLVEALLAGPAVEGLRKPLPGGVAVARAFVGEDGTVILDLVSPDAGPPPGVGSQAEMLMVYSVVDTILFNVEAAERVVLLWNGQQPTTFAGHLDTTRPLGPNTELLAAEDESPPRPLDPEAADPFAASPIDAPPVDAPATSPSGGTA